MADAIVNKIANSGLITLNLEAYLPKEQSAIFDLKDHLFMGLILKEKDFFFGLPQHLLNEYAALRSVLNIQYAGTGIGRIMKERLVPEHSLALSTIVSDETWFTELSYEQSIKYLQRQDLNFETKNKGWQLVCYEGQNLGWINALPNRINNYYPKELRILKQQNDSAFEK